MFRAAKTGNIDVVKRELIGHTDVNSQDKVVFLSLVFLCYVLGKCYIGKFLLQPSMVN